MTTSDTSSLASAASFIEAQFPVARLSMESYKERTAKQGQTLTGLGKWWGRKPLVLVRAALLGLLLPATSDPAKDRAIFLKLMTMDAEGLWQRKIKSIPGARLLAELGKLPAGVQQRFLAQPLPDLEVAGEEPAEPKLRKLSNAERTELQRLVFERMSYAEKLEYCARPEQVDGPEAAAWAEINAHLGTQARDLPGLVQELGLRRFGHAPRVGDAFCGGGSVPFEAARLGCDAYGSDLNPVAALLTWAALNIVGGGEEVAKAIAHAQFQVYDAVNRQVAEWGIEHNSLGWRADAYLYCAEVVDPESGWRVPLLPHFVIGEKTHTVVRLVPDELNRRYDIQILEGVSDEEMQAARNAGTVNDFRLIPPAGGSFTPQSTPIEAIRRDQRMWTKDDIIPHLEDVFQERLYCIRWVETFSDEKGKLRTRRHYRAPTTEDLHREAKVLQLLQERFVSWQEKGYIPSRKIESGKDINRPTTARGWTYWHHFFNPRQLLTTGLFAQLADTMHFSIYQRVGILLGIGRLADWNSRESRWISDAANEKSAQTFYKPSLPTPPVNYCNRACSALNTVFLLEIKDETISSKKDVVLQDARIIKDTIDIWMTDPPYADAVSYHEFSEFFLAWLDKHIPIDFPSWYTDSKRALAVVGTEMGFRESMVTCYRNLTRHMPDKGLQVVMFTHQDAAVWADLSLILWAAGLRVTAAWTIATETDSTLKQGNYVQGTVLLVLRKRTQAEPIFLDEIVPRLEHETRQQLNAMLALEDESDPNFGDADYQLAAYAAALRVLTAQPIEDIDPEKELLRPRQPGESSPVEALIRQAVQIACDHLVPRGLEREIWKGLQPLERFYLKGVEVESHGERRSGVYQELARGFGAVEYTALLADTRANETRLKTPGELERKLLGDFGAAGFAGSLLRQCLFAIFQTLRAEEAQAGLNYLRTELGSTDYWANRQKIIHLLEYLARLRYASNLPHWRKDAQAAALLAGAVGNDR